MNACQFWQQQIGAVYAVGLHAGHVSGSVVFSVYPWKWERPQPGTGQSRSRISDVPYFLGGTAPWRIHLKWGEEQPNYNEKFPFSQSGAIYCQMWKITMGIHSSAVLWIQYNLGWPLLKYFYFMLHCTSTSLHLRRKSTLMSVKSKYEWISMVLKLFK